MWHWFWDQVASEVQKGFLKTESGRMVKKSLLEAEEKISHDFFNGRTFSNSFTHNKRRKNTYIRTPFCLASLQVSTAWRGHGLGCKVGDRKTPLLGLGPQGSGGPSPTGKIMTFLGSGAAICLERRPLCPETCSRISGRSLGSQEVT